MSAGCIAEIPHPRSRIAQLSFRFLAVRKGWSFDRFDAMVLALYTAVLAWSIHHYQPFADEAQAWLIARDSSLHELLFRRLHYEGGAALWPIILWVASRFHMPFAGINWLGGAFAVTGVYTLLRYAPFPRIFRWLLPFTFFLQYEYAVIARPYVLLPVLLFSLCILYTSERPRPILFALVAGLLVNISLHAAIMAGVFALLYLYDLHRRRPHLSYSISPRSIAAATVVFLVLSLCSIAVAFPAPDTITALNIDKPVVKPNPLLRRLVPEEKLPPSSPPLDPPLDAKGAAAKVETRTDSHADAYPPLIEKTIFTIILAANAACYPIATSNLLAVLLLACLWYWLWTRGCPRLILPFLLSVFVSVNIFVLTHHTGIFLLALVAAVWIALNLPTQPKAVITASRWSQNSLGIVGIWVVLLQIGWSIYCIHQISHVPSDPGHATEAFLYDHFAGKRIAGFGFGSVSTQAYAEENLFINQEHSFWLWSANVFTDLRRSETLNEHPDAIVVADFVSGGESVYNQWHVYLPAGHDSNIQMLEYWEQHGYTETHRFCGTKVIRHGSEDTLCEVIMQPVIIPYDPASALNANRNIMMRVSDTATQ